MQISIFGLGHVGAVTAACMAERGHQIVGTDSDHTKVDMVASGAAPVLEPRLDALIDANVRAGRLCVTTDARAAILGSELSLICIGAGPAHDGMPDVEPLKHLAGQIGEAIAEKGRFHSVVIRSTVPPSTTRKVLLPILEEAAGTLGADFGLAHHPEFMREGSAVVDFQLASRSVIGELDGQTAERLVKLFGGTSTATYRTTPELSEMLKYADNAWHALKVAFANEIGTICRSAGVDGCSLMDLLCADTKLNLSSAYLKPGFAFGGACLPKDITALAALGRKANIDLPLLGGVEHSNEKHLQRSIDWVLESGRQRVAVLGIAYKPGIGDLRSSPFVKIVKALATAGRDVRVFDPDVCEARRTPSRRSYIDGAVDGIGSLLTDDADELIAWADAIVVCSANPSCRAALDTARPEQIVLDFARMVPGDPERYAYRSFM